MTNKLLKLLLFIAVTAITQVPFLIGYIQEETCVAVTIAHTECTDIDITRMLVLFNLPTDDIFNAPTYCDLYMCGVTTILNLF